MLKVSSCDLKAAHVLPRQVMKQSHKGRLSNSQFCSRNNLPPASFLTDFGTYDFGAINQHGFIWCGLERHWLDCRAHVSIISVLLRARVMRFSTITTFCT
jgi:hypothetical protein